MCCNDFWHDEVLHDLVLKMCLHPMNPHACCLFHQQTNGDVHVAETRIRQCAKSKMKTMVIQSVKWAS